ncbi:MAG: glycosyltransferase family 39 protein [Nocardioides sp.]|uniref:glycosyltransferase family 39 protein n=1 Tax=Nocardioides sp. TaxID=35761 RepID=UPI0039E6328C
MQDPPLWYDEAYTRLASSVPLHTLLSGVWHRQGVIGYLMDVPPSFNAPYYVLMHGWCAVFGTGDVALRLPSLLCSATAVAVMAVLGQRLAGPVAGLVTGLLCAVSPLLAGQAVQARDYGAAMLAVALCALWLVSWRSTGRGVRRVAFAAGAAGLLHWFTLPVIAGLMGVALTSRFSWRPRCKMVLALALAVVPAALLVGWSLAGGTYGAPTPPTVGWSLPVTAVRDWSGTSPLLAGLLAIAALAGALTSRHRALILGWVVVPLMLVTAVELTRPTYFPRYLLFTLLGLALAAALGVAAVRWRPARLLLATALVGLSLAVTVPRLDVSAEEPSPAVVALLAREQSAGEPIIPADGRTSLDLETYLSVAPRIADDLVLPPTLFTDQTTSDVVWLVRVVLKVNSLPIVPAQQRLIDAGWTRQAATLVTGSTTDLRVEKWVR